MNEIKTERLEKIGFKSASDKIKKLKELKHKMAIAYENFRFVRPNKIDEFNKKLQEETRKENKQYFTYKCLTFIPLDQYEEIPPLDVLDKIERAQELGCFDTFEIAKIQDIKQVKDPIVFGRINNCPDRFFVAQWDDDVKIEDILKENEG